MADVGTLTAYVEADMRKLKVGLERANKQLGRFTKNTEGNMRRASRAIARFSLNASRRLGRFALRTSKWATIALAGIGIAATKMAMDAEEAENLFNVSMGNMADEACKWSQEMADSLGLYDVEMRKNLATFFMMIKNMGIAEVSAFKMSKALTMLAYDMASLRNIKFEEAFIKIQAGITGEIEPLKRLGIVINETAVKNWALVNGIIKQGQELTEAQKILIRYNLILEQTREDQGDLRRTIDSATNSWRIMWDQLKSLGRQIGDVLLPYVEALFKTIRSWLSKNRDNIIRWVQSAVDGLAFFVRYLRHDWRAALELALKLAFILFQDFAGRMKYFGRAAAENFAIAFIDRFGLMIGEYLSKGLLEDMGFWDVLFAGPQRRAAFQLMLTPMLEKLGAMAEKARKGGVNLPRALEAQTQITARRIKEAIAEINVEAVEWEMTIKRANKWLDKVPTLAEIIGESFQRMDDVYQKMDVFKEAGEVTKKVATSVDTIEDHWYRAARRIEVSMADAFDTIIEGTKDVGEAFKEFGRSIVKSMTMAISDIIAQWIMYQTLTGLGKWTGLPMLTAIEGRIGSPFMHFGGAVGSGQTIYKMSALAFAGAPRLHRGLRADEFPAILQRGEEVIPKDAQLQAPNVIINNNTPVPLKQEGAPRFDGRNWVVAIVAENIHQGGLLRSTIQGISRRS